MMRFEQALAAVLGQIEPLACEPIQVPLDRACGRIAAGDVLAQYDAPLFDNSAMDGYAVCSGGNEGGDESRREYSVVGTVRAGDAATVPLEAGQAMRIFTGAPTPPNTDAVVAQEHTQVDGARLLCVDAVVRGAHVRVQGEEWRVGARLIAAHTCLCPAHIGLLAAQGYAAVAVLRPVRVCVFSTGNELVHAVDGVRSGQLFDANRPMLLAWLQALGHEVHDGGILPDDAAQIAQQVSDAAQRFDCIVTSGGASVGQEDHLKAVIGQLGQLTQWQVAMKPGKPFGWGTIGRCVVLMLPGNPVASFVTFRLLGIPALARLQGLSSPPSFVASVAQFDWDARAQRRDEFVRGHCWVNEHAQWCVRPSSPASLQGSHMLGSCATANAFIYIPAGSVVAVGHEVRMVPLDAGLC